MYDNKLKVLKFEVTYKPLYYDKLSNIDDNR